MLVEPDGRQRSREERLPGAHDRCDTERRDEEQRPSLRDRHECRRAGQRRDDHPDRQRRPRQREKEAAAHPPPDERARGERRDDEQQRLFDRNRDTEQGNKGQQDERQESKEDPLPSLLTRCRGWSRRDVRLVAVLNRSPSPSTR